MITVRRATKEDRPMIEKWLKNDEFHQSIGLTSKEFDREGTELYMVLDESGPIFVARLHRAIRLGIQYNPETTRRNAKGTAEFMKWLMAKACSESEPAIEVIAKPGGKAVALAERLGFEDFTGKIFRWN